MQEANAGLCKQKIWARSAETLSGKQMNYGEGVYYSARAVVK